jgi:hypothetical protein
MWGYGDIMDYFDAYEHDEVAARELETGYWADLEAQFDADLIDRIVAECGLCPPDTYDDTYDTWIELWDGEMFGAAALRDMYGLDDPCAWTSADQFDHDLSYVLAYA